MYPYPFPTDAQPLYPFHHPPGLFPAPVSSYSSHLTVEKDGVRTVYVTNLPADVTHREIHNLFRLSCPGFEACKFGKDRSDTHVKCAFASFVDRAAASRAIQTLNRFRFDPQQPELLLRVEFAKADDRSLTSKRSGGLMEHRSGSLLEQRSGSLMEHRSGSLLEQRSGNLIEQRSGNLVEQRSGTLVDHEHDKRPTSPAPGSPTPEREGVPQLPPCSTLYVSGFLSATTEDLKPYFESTPGFVRFAMGKDGRHAFINYIDIQSSSAAMTALNGTPVGPLATPISITYAKKVVPTPSGQLM